MWARFLIGNFYVEHIMSFSLIGLVQIHTTGTDVYHPSDIVAATTLFKDNTLRDYAQGCWRMRDLGGGHSVHVVVRKFRSTCSTLLFIWLLCRSSASSCH